MAYSEPARPIRLSRLAWRRCLASSGAGRRAVGLVHRRWLVALWWLLSAMLVAVVVVVTRPAPEVARLGPAEDDDLAVWSEPDGPASRVGLAPPDESVLPAGFDERPGLYVATGGPPLPLRDAPAVEGSVLVRVPDGAPLDDLAEITPDGAWRRVGWDGWEGWIAAGLLRQR